MAFFNKIFTGTDNVTADFSSGGNHTVVKKSVPMRRLPITVEDEEMKKTERRTADQEKGMMSTKMSDIKNPQKGIGQTRELEEEKENETNKTERNGEDEEAFLRLKSLAEQIRNRVHYIDKNDFARRAVSSKDKVYDFDLRRDLAYFLANDEFSEEIEEGIRREKKEDAFREFEKLILQAAGNEEIGYVVYGERTYLIGKMDEKRVELERTKERSRKVEKLADEKKINDFSGELMDAFSKNAIKFVDNLKKESETEVPDLITQEDHAVLIKIFTKRFIREMILEKEAAMKKKMFQSRSESERLVETVFATVFKKD